ncbi:hypothetical protein AYI69_g8686 [Smittium culicis]|uniref:Uncharacterized protein n=1 Tax=Smittium culicis TaxID=133412 RepID=A0A1R1XHV4_9FUNG|nr:hypothetical protein AYI69_g8686 [Smittium culicis]
MKDERDISYLEKDNPEPVDHHQLPINESHDTLQQYQGFFHRGNETNQHEFSVDNISIFFNWKCTVYFYKEIIWPLDIKEDYGVEKSQSINSQEMGLDIQTDRKSH